MEKQDENEQCFIANSFHPEGFKKSMRSDFDNYKHFVYRFVRCIVGRREFDLVIANWKIGQKEDTLATVSDEALALLSFENNFDVWEDVYDKSKGEIRPIPRDMEYPKEWISEKSTKYTTKRDAKGKPIDTNDKSWSAEGILRYNELLKVVARDRMRNPEFIEKFIEWKKHEGDFSPGNSGKVERDESDFPIAHHTLFHNPDNLNELSFTPVKNLSKRSGSKAHGKSRQLDSSSSDEDEWDDDDDDNGREENNSGSDTDINERRTTVQRKLKLK